MTLTGGRLRRLWGIAVIGLLSAGCGSIFPTAQQQSEEEATAAVREHAFAAQGLVSDALSDADGADSEALLDLLADRIEGGETNGTVLSRGVEADGTLRLDVVFVERREGGAGSAGGSAAMRLCVRIAGAPGTDAAAAVSDLDCPAELGDVDPVEGTIDAEVRLSDEG